MLSARLSGRLLSGSISSPSSRWRELSHTTGSSGTVAGAGKLERPSLDLAAVGSPQWPRGTVALHGPFLGWTRSVASAFGQQHARIIPCGHDRAWPSIAGGHERPWPSMGLSLEGRAPSRPLLGSSMPESSPVATTERDPPLLAATRDRGPPWAFPWRDALRRFRFWAAACQNHRLRPRQSVALHCCWPRGTVALHGFYTGEPGGGAPYGGIKPKGWRSDPFATELSRRGRWGRR